MTYRGRVKNGVVVFDDRADLPEGAEVSVSVRSVKTTSRTPKRKRKIPTLYDRLKPLIGKAKGLPPDLAKNHDHYIHGAPKRK